MCTSGRPLLLFLLACARFADAAHLGVTWRSVSITSFDGTILAANVATPTNSTPVQLFPAILVGLCGVV